MIISVTKQIIEIVNDEIMAEVSEHPGVKNSREDLNDLLEAIFEHNPELFSKVETAIYEYSETFAKHTFPLAFIYGMRMMRHQPDYKPAEYPILKRAVGHGSFLLVLYFLFVHQNEGKHLFP